MHYENGEYILTSEESLRLLRNTINRLNPYDMELQSTIDSYTVTFTNDEIIVDIPDIETTNVENVTVNFADSNVSSSQIFHTSQSSYMAA